MPTLDRGAREPALDLDRPTLVSVSRPLPLPVAVLLLFVGSCSQSSPDASAITDGTLTQTTTAPDPAQPSIENRNHLSIPYKLIAEDISAGDPWTVDLITTHRDYSLLGLPNRTYEAGWGLSFRSHVVLLFNVPESSSTNCAVEPMTDLVFDSEHGVVAPVFGTGDSDEETCNMDANPHLVVVSVERSVLPQTNFKLWFDPSLPPDGLAEKVRSVTPDDLEPSLPTLEFDASLAVGETKIAYGVITHCGIDPLTWPVNSRQWQLIDSSQASGIDPMPAGWTSPREGLERIDLAIEHTAKDLLTITEVGTDLSLQYMPLPDKDFFGCE